MERLRVRVRRRERPADPARTVHAVALGRVRRPQRRSQRGRHRRHAAGAKVRPRGRRQRHVVARARLQEWRRVGLRRLRRVNVDVDPALPQPLRRGSGGALAGAGAFVRRRPELAKRGKLVNDSVGPSRVLLLHKADERPVAPRRRQPVGQLRKAATAQPAREAVDAVGRRAPLQRLLRRWRRLRRRRRLLRRRRWDDRKCELTQLGTAAAAAVERGPAARRRELHGARRTPRAAAIVRGAAVQTLRVDYEARRAAFDRRLIQRRIVLVDNLALGERAGHHLGRRRAARGGRLPRNVVEAARRLSLHPVAGVRTGDVGVHLLRRRVWRHERPAELGDVRRRRFGGVGPQRPLERGWRPRRAAGGVAAAARRARRPDDRRVEPRTTLRPRVVVDRRVRRRDEDAVRAQLARQQLGDARAGPIGAVHAAVAAKPLGAALLEPVDDEIVPFGLHVLRKVAERPVWALAQREAAVGVEARRVGVAHRVAHRQPSSSTSFTLTPLSLRGTSRSELTRRRPPRCGDCSSSSSRCAAPPPSSRRRALRRGRSYHPLRRTPRSWRPPPSAQPWRPRR